MSVCRSQEVTIAVVFPISFYFCDISTDLSSVFFFPSVSVKHRFCTMVKWQVQWSTLSASPFLTSAICLKYNRILVKVKISRTGQGHFLIVNPRASIFVCRQYWLGLEKWTHSIFAGEKSWPSHVSERSSLIMVQLLKQCQVRWLLADGGGGGGGGFFCPSIVIKPPSNIAELFSEAVLVKLFHFAIA